jgi:glucuronoarabinoxylan endo-1,4-beta-xylanase
MIFAFLVSVPSLWAAGGTCPSGANYLSEPTDALVTLATLGVTNCYFIAAAGNDANTGTDEAHPWAHAPGMYGSSSNSLANINLSPGTGIIFRGGDTWHYGNGTTTSTGLPWTCGYPYSCSGTATNPVYIGVDLTWYAGASWTRPIFNMDNPLSTSTVASCVYDDGSMTGALNHEPVFFYSVSYVIFDDFEFKGYCWDNQHGTYIYENGVGLEMLRLYFHGWTYVPETGATCNGGLCDVNHMITGGAGPVTFAFNTFDGFDSSPNSGAAMYAQNAYDVHNSVFRHLSNGMVGGPIHTFHDNLAEYLTLSYDNATHANVWEFLSADPGNNYYYNNVIRNVSNDGGIKLWVRTGSQTSTDYVYNNVIYGSTNTNCFNYSQAVAGTTTNTVNFFNNTFDQCTIDSAGNSLTNAFAGTFNFENNQFIGYGAQNLAAVWSAGGTTTTAVDLGGNIYQTEATANSQGYVAATNYLVTSASGATVGAGSNLTSTCSTVGTALCSDTTLGDTRTPNARPTSGAWDGGASQYSTTSTVSVPSCTPVSGAYSSVTMTCTDATPGASIYYNLSGTATCSSTLYSAPVVLTLPVTVSLIGCKSGYTSSAPTLPPYAYTSSSASTVTVNWTTQHQVIDGWGGVGWIDTISPPNNGYKLTSSQAAQFFSPTLGIGLEYIRTQNFGCPGTGACEVSTSNMPDLVTLQEAVSDGAKIEVDINPPANLQYSGTNGGAAGANGTCIPNANWSTFATYTVNWIQMLNVSGAPVSVLGVANEPNDTMSGTANTFTTCMWSAAGLDSYIGGTLGPALSSAGLLSSVKVMMPQTSGWFSPDDASTCLNDSTCSQYVSIASSHGYDGAGSVDGTGSQYCCATATTPPMSTNGKRIWMNEVNGGFNYDSTSGVWLWENTMQDALVWAHSIHDYLTKANASAWFYWQLLDTCGGNYSGGCVNGPLNDGLGYPVGSGQIPSSLVLASRFYAVGNWSKFVRSGYYRIDATANPQSGVYITAFQNAVAGNIVIVAVNSNSSTKSQTLAITNAPTFSSLTPYVTSASLNLAAQSAATLTGNSFTYTLPASSVTSFVGIGATSGPAVSLSPASLTFSSQIAGTTSPAQSIVLTNTGGSTMTISGISITGANSGDFNQTNTCGSSLGAGSNCSISVSFTPSLVGSESASINVADSAAGSPQTVSLAGTGVAPLPPIPSNVILLQ